MTVCPEPRDLSDYAGYDHLKEVEFHPELLHKLIRPLARAGTLRWQRVGGKPDGIYLFVVGDKAFQVEWDGMQYRPVDPFTLDTKRRNPFLFSLVVDAMLRRIARKQ
jgi:hypothetical protein